MILTKEQRYLQNKDTYRTTKDTEQRYLQKDKDTYRRTKLHTGER